MAKVKYRTYRYAADDGYDKEVAVNGEKVRVFSTKRVDELNPDGWQAAGETWERKRRDKDKDVGRIEVADKILYVSPAGTHEGLLRGKRAVLRTEDGGYLALLGLRPWPFVLIALLLAACLAAGLFAVLGGKGTSTVGDITPVEPTVLTITGTVTKEGAPAEGARLSLQRGNDEVASATTDSDGKYLINDVKNGNYNLVCTYGDSVLTKMASVWGRSIVVDFAFPADDLHDVGEITGVADEALLPESRAAGTGVRSDVKALVRITDQNTPAVAVGGLSEEAMLHMVVGKEVDLTFLATKLADGSVPAQDKAAIEAISGELEMTYYDFSVLKEVFRDRQLESSEYLTTTKTVLEVAVPFDSSHSVDTYAFRFHGGQALKLEKLSERPTGGYRDGTCFVANDFVYIYTSCFSTYAIGAANAGQVTRGSDTITYSGQAAVDLQAGTVSLLYQHDADSTNSAKVGVYLVGTGGNLLIAESGEIPAGYQVTELALRDGLAGMPSVGTYEGVMKITYLGADGGAATNVDIPLTVAITR